MKKKILKIILILIIMISVTGCGENSKLNEIAKKINNCESVKNYKEYGYDIKATATKDTLTVNSKMGDTKSKVDYKLNGNILSNENLSITDLMSTLLVLNGVGQTYGYKDGELSQNINAFTEDYKKYTLDKEGLELIMSDESDKVSIKIDISKKIPLIDINTFFLKSEDLDIIKDLVEEKKAGNQSGKSGNIAYDVFVTEEGSTIQIGQDDKLSDSAYQSILTALEVIYGENTANHFQEIYPEFKKEKISQDGFIIETDYKVEDQEESIFKDTEVVLVTIDNNSIKR
ncbi:MAG: hypothetical protein IJG68_04115 [Bacilli bacterium]|nr:hypothetical protein [Bacilli bacterium]